MSHDPRLFSPTFSIDVCTDNRTAAVSNKIDANELIVNLLKQLVEGQQREIKLLEEVAQWVGLNHKQRQHEITQWKESNPDLARSCRIATEALVKVQNEFIHKLTEEAADGFETMMDSEYMLSEFIDRFGPRMAHLGGVLHMVSSLSAAKEAKEAPRRLPLKNNKLLSQQPRMHVELVRTVTRDGLRLDGALHPHRGPLPKREGTETSASNTAAILLHGVAGNFYTSSTFEPLIPRLQALGIAALAVNTRGHDSVFGASQGNVRRRFGAAYETVDNCRHDVAAWVEFLKSRSYGRIVLIGHSLGAIKAVYAQARESFPGVTVVVAVSGPRLSCSAFLNASESSIFFDSFSAAERMVKEGRGDELFTSKFPFPLLITASAYIDKYGPAERYNLLKFAGDLPCPALFVYGSKELAGGGIAFAGMPEALMSLPGADRRTTVIIDGADHVYTGVGEQLAEAVIGWLARSLQQRE